MKKRTSLKLHKAKSINLKGWSMPVLEDLSDVLHKSFLKGLSEIFKIIASESRHFYAEVSRENPGHLEVSFALSEGEVADGPYVLVNVKDEFQYWIEMELEDGNGTDLSKKTIRDVRVWRETLQSIVVQLDKVLETNKKGK